jgi:hypothetical protein
MIKALSCQYEYMCNRGHCQFKQHILLNSSAQTHHGTVKSENRNWKFGLHAFVLRNLQTQTEDKVIEVYFVSFFTNNFGPMDHCEKAWAAPYDRKYLIGLFQGVC